MIYTAYNLGFEFYRLLHSLACSGKSTSSNQGNNLVGFIFLFLLRYISFPSNLLLNLMRFWGVKCLFLINGKIFKSDESLESLFFLFLAPYEYWSSVWLTLGISPASVRLAVQLKRAVTAKESLSWVVWALPGLFKWPLVWTYSRSDVVNTGHWAHFHLGIQRPFILLGV